MKLRGINPQEIAPFVLQVLSSNKFSRSRIEGEVYTIFFEAIVVNIHLPIPHPQKGEKNTSKPNIDLIKVVTTIITNTVVGVVVDKNKKKIIIILTIIITITNN